MERKFNQMGRMLFDIEALDMVNDVLFGEEPEEDCLQTVDANDAKEEETLVLVVPGFAVEADAANAMDASDSLYDEERMEEVSLDPGGSDFLIAKGSSPMG